MMQQQSFEQNGNNVIKDKKVKTACPLCGSKMLKRQISPMFLCSCGHAEGFVYPKNAFPVQDIIEQEYYVYNNERNSSHC